MKQANNSRDSAFGWGVGALTAAALSLACGVAVAQPTHELGDSGELIQLAEPDPTTHQGQLQLIRRTLVSGEYSRAEDQADAWIEANPLAGRMPEALMLRADAIAAQGDYYRSLTDYELVVGLYPGTEYYRTALEREYDIAKMFTDGLNRRDAWFGWRLYPADDVGVELLIRIQERLPGSDLGERASIAIGDYYFQLGDMEMASEAYDLFLLNYPRSQQREWAMLRQIQASLARYKGPEFDPSGLTDAAQRLSEYMDEFPAAAERIGAESLLVRINESLAEKKLTTARWYDQRGLELSAVTLYRRVIEDYPRSVAAREALRELEERNAPLVDPRAPRETNRPTPETDPTDTDPGIDPTGGAGDD